MCNCRTSARAPRLIDTWPRKARAMGRKGESKRHTMFCANETRLFFVTGPVGDAGAGVVKSASLAFKENNTLPSFLSLLFGAGADGGGFLLVPAASVLTSRFESDLDGKFSRAGLAFAAFAYERNRVDDSICRLPVQPVRGWGHGARGGGAGMVGVVLKAASNA